jgi:hypothetical protein
VTPVYALPPVAAYAAGVKVKTLNAWVRRGHISAPVRGCYDLAEIEDWIVNRRDSHHAKIAESRYGSGVSHRFGPTDC